MLNNDWKKEYRSEMDRQKPSDKALSDLMGAMETEKSKTTSRRRRIRSWAALAACFALIVALANPITGLFEKGGKYRGVNTPASYKQLYNELSDIVSGRYEKSTGGVTWDGLMPAPGAVPAPESDTAAESADGTPDYSDTNLQVAGVQEADIIKTDGRYIYAISSEYLYIVSAIDGKLEKIAELPRSTYDENTLRSAGAFEMYVTDDRLIVLKYYSGYYPMYKFPVDGTVVPSDGGSDKEPTVAPAPAPVEPDRMSPSLVPPYYPYWESTVGVELYDITDKAAPKQLKSFSQSGSYVSSRMIDDVVYLISNEYIYSIDETKPETFVPQVYDGKEVSLLAPEDISICIDPIRYTYSAQYLVVSGIDTSGEGSLVSTKSLLGSGGSVYASRNSLYVAAYSWQENEKTASDATQLYRFSLDNGNVKLEAEGSVPGSILNQFSMDEHNGTFRIVTTVNSYTYSGGGNGDAIWRSVAEVTQYNSLFTLNSDLEIIGSVEKLAGGERVYSVRFDGDIGYFVTFRQVDPLFSVDLSDPKNPTVLGELKIPGFSEYLHPYADGLLFGLGKDADAESGKVGFLKLSMFNTSDPSNVTEANKLIIEGTYYSDASYNHKAILVDGRRNIIAFPADGKYLVYSYTPDRGFTQEAVITLTRDVKDYNYYYYQNMRGLYIGDYLYVVADTSISSYSMETYTLSSVLDLTA